MTLGTLQGLSFTPRCLLDMYNAVVWQETPENSHNHDSQFIVAGSPLSVYAHCFTWLVYNAAQRLMRTIDLPFP